ncbi:uncharacterized protein CFP56_017742 [Quercus suber]|uniref:CCHC-type domain-containing protein n=2 Tax=Quercus suber TaxID=58331 RepID=A0AAW0M0A0_QUESU|nr:uncharacterized protein CFP56_35374 [Quercus suber]
MAEELEELWKKLTFTEEEDVGIVIDSSSTKAAKEVGKCCAVMKILTQRCINLDALRKNLRMLWKPNKGVQISEIDEDLFLVEFGDEKDKKRVMEMCPWSYEKQLVLIQDFDGELTPKEIDLRWASFWVQIYNLPLKCRTKETGWAIGSSLGMVMDVDVPESGVQWGKCLRVRVRIDATKRLLRGKKISIESGESRWVSFKFERLPNFCYRCGLLNHALKDCTEGHGHSSDEGASCLQYGAWLRGEPIRRNGFVGSKLGVRTEAERSSEKTEERTGSALVLTQQPRKEAGVGMDHGVDKTSLQKSVPMQGEVGTALHLNLSENIHGKGNLQEGVGKSGRTEASLGSQDKVMIIDQAEPLVGMQWETGHPKEAVKEQVAVLAPSIKKEAKARGPTNMGP